MTKDTINKVFQKAFQSNIWKIEMDTEQHQLAIETRDTDTTIPTFYAIDFKGTALMHPLIMEEKEWTLDGIQNGFIVLKCVGEHTPIQEGVQVRRISDGQNTYFSREHILVDTFAHCIIVRHRNIASGQLWKIALDTGQSEPFTESETPPTVHTVNYPIPYKDTPAFFENTPFERPLWLSKVENNYLWCYHQVTENGFDLILTKSDLNQILDQQVILSGMEKMIPQPYFQLGNQIFFMTYNKRKIIAFLV